MKYNKLIRDKIPEIIKNDNKVPSIHTANNEEYWEKLKAKLIEEVDEFLEESNEEELSDVLEVIDAVCEFKNFDEEEIEKLKKEKAKKRGKFNKRIILDEVED